MTDNAKKTIVNFAKNFYPLKDLDFKVIEHSGEPYLILTVDVAKADYNSNQFDKNYFNLITNKEQREKSNSLILFITNTNFMSPICNGLRKFMDVHIKSGFDFKNYDHLDKIMEVIDEAIKKSSEPNVEAEFTAEWDKPKVSLTLYGVRKLDDNSFIEELKTILKNKVNLDSYSIIRTKGKK